MVCNHFFPFGRLPFHFVGSFAVQKLSSLIQSHFFIFVFGSCVFGVICKKGGKKRKRKRKSLPRPMSGTVPSRFSSGNFTISDLVFKSVIYFELIFVSRVKSGSNFILLQVSISFPNTIY